MLEFRFDTQLLIEGHGLDEDAIHDYIQQNIAGDCLLAVGDEDLIKIHFHTNPLKVLEYCAGLRTFTTSSSKTWSAGKRLARLIFRKTRQSILLCRVFLFVCSYLAARPRACPARGSAGDCPHGRVESVSTRSPGSPGVGAEVDCRFCACSDKIRREIVRIRKSRDNKQVLV